MCPARLIFLSKKPLLPTAQERSGVGRNLRVCLRLAVMSHDLATGRREPVRPVGTDERLPLFGAGEQGLRQLVEVDQVMITQLVTLVTAPNHPGLVAIDQLTKLMCGLGRKPHESEALLGGETGDDLRRRKSVDTRHRT